LKNKKVWVVKLLWRSSQVEEETWKRESKIKRKYSKLFLDSGTWFSFEDEVFKGGKN
jgi:hypothetical protein